MTDEKKDIDKIVIKEIEPVKTQRHFLDLATEELVREIKEHPEADIAFSDEIPTSPELRVQIQKNITTSKKVVMQASTILETLKRRSTHPPKE